MSTIADVTGARRSPEPILGPTARLAIQAAREARVSHDAAKLLVLLAAYRDAGEARPPVRALAERLGTDPGGVDALLKELARARLVWVTWRAPGTGERNRYALLFAADKRWSDKSAALRRGRTPVPQQE